MVYVSCVPIKAALSVGKLLGYWNIPYLFFFTFTDQFISESISQLIIPYLSFSSIDPQLADKKTHNTLIRMMSPFNHMINRSPNSNPNQPLLQR